MSVIEKNYEFMVNRGKMTEEMKDSVFGLVTSSLDYQDVSDCDIVIEAVYENLDLKEKIFRTLDEVVKKDAILASNTSGLNVDSIAAFFISLTGVSLGISEIFDAARSPKKI